jgi:hypothetical protein
MHTLAMHQAVALSEQETHQPPGKSFTIEQAHRDALPRGPMRCPRKDAAVEALVDASRLVPSEHHPR